MISIEWRWVARLTCLALLVGGLGAESPCKADDDKPPVLSPTRFEIAQSYQAFERTVAATNMLKTDPKLANKVFDDVSLLFFQARLLEAKRRLDEFVTQHDPQANGVSHQLTRTLRILHEPIHHHAAKPTDVSIRIRRFFPLPDVGNNPVTLLCVGQTNNPQVIWSSQLDLAKTSTKDGIQLSLPATVLLNKPVGRYHLALQVGDGERQLLPGVLVLAASTLDEFKSDATNRITALNKRLSVDPAGNSARLASLRSISARLAYLQQKRDDFNSTSFQLDPYTLREEIAADLSKLEQGADPFAQRVGDHWRVVPLTNAGSATVPVRIFNPPAAADAKSEAGRSTAKPSDGNANGNGNGAVAKSGPASTPESSTDQDRPTEKLPVVFLLHGAGGDEHMFFDAYGMGMIKQLAQERKFVAVALPTYQFALSAGKFADVLDQLAQQYPIDRTRVYLVGHSMGTGAALAIHRTKPELITGICLLAGNEVRLSKQQAAPIYLIVGETDPLIPSQRFRQRMMEQAAKQPKLFRFESVSAFGHTLVVTEKLPAAIDWLLAQRKER